MDRSGPSSAVAPRPLVEIRDLTVNFVSREATVAAVNGVSFDVLPGEVLCIIGESGSGKSVTMRSILRLHPPRRTVVSGSIRVGEHDILALSEQRHECRAWPRRLHDLPGADDRARSGLPHRRPDRRDRDAPRGLLTHEPRWHARWSCCNWSRFHRRSVACAPIRTSCRAACASAP